MSLVELSESVGLSQTPCKRRLKRLEEAGLIAGYRARIDRKAAGFGITAFVSVELARQEGKAFCIPSSCASKGSAQSVPALRLGALSTGPGSHDAALSHAA